MHIAMIATSRHPVAEPYAGGQESHTALLARGLRELGHHVRMYAPEGSDPGVADELVPYRGLPDLSAVAALDPQLPEPDFLRDHAAFTAAVVDLLARPVDVVHNQSLNFLPLAFSPALDAPLVTTLHTPPFPWMELGVALASPSAEYVCVSRTNAADWSTLPTRPRVIHNGVADDRGGSGAGGDGLVWVGRLTHTKGCDLAISAARRAGRRLTIVGPVSERAWFDDVIAPQLDDRVRYAGHLPHSELAALVRASAATLVTPRWEEPFGLVAAESATWGTPVIALDRGGLAEFVTPEIGVLVRVRGDADSIVRGLSHGVDAAASLPREGVRHAALRDLGADRMVREYASLYHELIGSGRGRS